ncbi:MAG: class I SAM-dependent methyltransferase [Acidimicrobiales bacterium]|jgi:hypothetical protein
MTSPAVGTFSCVIDEDPRFHLEALRWFASITAVAGASPCDLTVHVVGSADSDALDILEGKGVTIRPIRPFDSRSAHCNKIAGALSLAAAGVEGLAVLTDADVMICEDPRALLLEPGAVAAKTVDAPNPPLDIVRTVFDRAGVELPPIVALDFDPVGETIEGNANGGLYLVPGPLLAQVAEAWDRWARWLLDRQGLLGSFGVFVDQMAMALALGAEGIPFQRLDPRWNTLTHIHEWIPEDVATPAVIHYHDALTPTGLLARSGFAAIDERIDVCNDAVVRLWNESFPNATFWEWRYRSNPELGSGVGSRGTSLDEKRQVLVDVMDMVRPGSTLDVGCGDGEATRGLAIPNYRGIDLSDEAIRLARAARPEDTFYRGTLVDHPLEADLTICMDVLIHQSDGATYRDLVRRLLRSAHRALLVSGYEQEPRGDRTMTHFHEPLSDTIRRIAPGVEMSVMRVDNETTTWLVDTARA